MRGFLESILDDALQEKEEEGFVAGIEWVQQEIPISSLRELVLGYVIGALEAICYAVATVRKRLSKKEEKEAEETIRTMIKRRLPEIMEIIESELGR